MVRQHMETTMPRPIQLPLRTRQLSVIREARAAVEIVHGSLQPGLCIPLMLATILAASRRGITLVPQAGSASFWMRAPEWIDDGVSHTHFSYMWSGVPQRLPDGGVSYEVHAWAGDPVAQHFVDASTKWVADACKLTAGMTWEAGTPPDHVWGDLPRGWHYDPSRDATAHVMAQIEDLGMVKDLSKALREVRA